MTGQADLYNVLEVAANATREEIRDAYYRQVRRHPPEKDPRGFQLVQRAYEVLGNATTRKEYDDQRQADPQTQALVDEGRRLLKDGDPEAVTPLKRALVRQPDSLVVRDLLVQALLFDEDFDTAEKHAKLLIQREPSNAVYHLRLGDVLRDADRDDEAEQPYRRALELDQETPQPVLKLAYLLNYLERSGEAITILRRAIVRDGRIDFEDFLFFQALCRVYISRDELDRLAEIRTEIRKILPPDQETRSFVAWFYYRDALTLADHRNFDAALSMIEEAAAIDDSLPELKDAAGRIRSSKEALDEIDRLRDDPHLLPELRFAALSLVVTRVFGTSEQIKTAYDQAFAALERHCRTEGSPLKSHLEVMARKYPSTAAIATDLMAFLRDRISTADNTFVALKCPGCGQEGYAKVPDLQSLVSAGLPHDQAEAILKNRGVGFARRYVAYRCDECGTRYNGLSEKIVDAPPPRSGKDKNILTTDVGDLISPRARSIGCIVVVCALLWAIWYFDSSPRQVRPKPEARPSRSSATAVPAGTRSSSSRVEDPPPEAVSSWHSAIDGLNVRSGPSTSHSRIAQLDRFDSVRVHGAPSGGWAKVSLDRGIQGYVATRFLAAGPGDIARRNWCRENSGPRPVSGEILRQRARGPHKLTVKNAPGVDAVVKLKRRDQTVLSFYVRGGQTVVIDSVPEGVFTTMAAYGSGYSRKCGYFLDNLSVSLLEEAVAFRTTQDAYYRYTTTLEYTLYRVTGGNLSPKTATLDEFVD